MSSSFDVIVVGRATIDAFLTIDENNKHFGVDLKKRQLCVRFGDKALVDKVDFLPGGNAANVGVGLSRLGLRAAVAAEVGEDDFAKRVIVNLESEKTDSSLVISSEKPTDFSVIINTMGERTIFCEDLEREHNFDFSNFNTDWIYLTSLTKKWVEAYEKVLQLAQKNDAKIAFNPGTSQIDAGYNFLSKFLKQTEILFVNKEEAQRIVSSKHGVFPKGIKELLSEIAQMGVKTVVVTDGVNGSYVLQDGKFIEKNDIKDEAVERTGAGDSYAVGFLASYIKGQDLRICVDWGSINAASVVSRIGAQPGLLRFEEINK